MPAPIDSKLAQAMARFRNALLAGERASAARLVTAYGRIYERLQDKIRALEADIGELGDNPTRGQIVRLRRYQELLSQTAEEMDRYAVILENEIATSRAAAITQGLEQSKRLVQLALPNLPPQAQALIMSRFNKLPAGAVANMLGQLSESSPLPKLLETFGEDAAKAIGSSLLEGVALGYNPVKVAAMIRDQLGGNLTRALVISRTEMLRAYRTASLQNYAANADIVKGWQWSATKDNVTCLACLALDGREFGADETFFPAHPNCRCAPEPVTVSYKDLGLNVSEPGPRQTAAEWFETLPESKQREYFSGAAWRAYQDGAVRLKDFIGLQESEDWGPAYVEKSLKGILGERAGQYYGG